MINQKIWTDFKYCIGEEKVSNCNDHLIILERYRKIKKVKKRGNYTECSFKYYKVKCTKCGFTNEVSESNLYKGEGCPVCRNKIIIEGINDIATTDPWMVPYMPEGLDLKHIHSGSSMRIKPKCPYCGRIKEKEMRIFTIKKQKSIGCICGDSISYPNKFMFNILSQLNIDCEREFSPTWIYPKRYDFYIPEKNLIIEMDGGLGHGKQRGFH